MSGKHRGTQCCAFGCTKREKKDARSNSAVMIIIYQKTVYKDNSLVSYFLLWFLCYVRSAVFEFITICTILAAEVEINIATKEK